MPVNASEQIEKFQEFIDTFYKKEIHNLITTGKKSFLIDFKDLSKFDPDLAEQLLDEPEETIKAAELSFDKFDLPEKTTIRTRFKNLPESQKIIIKDIRSQHIDKLITIEGIVRQASDVRPQVISAKFECPSCGNTISILQIEQKFKEPYRCSCGRKGRFRLLSKDLVDVQRLIIEESPESLEGGEQPKRISILLKEDLVEPRMEKKTTPGSKIRVFGIVREVPILLRTGAQSIRYDLMMESNHIEPVEETFEEMDISKEEEESIKELSKEPGIYEKLTNSIAPSIYGHENIKLALALQLMGGVRKIKSDGTITRGDTHILLVGDPGAAKSSILVFISKAAPKARFISGKGASGAGITASVVKDEFIRGWALEAGALVLAHKGIACLDELDKMAPEDRSALHEALEQQQITISKANIQATLKAETTVLAAANPKYGRFDPYKPIAQQIDLPPTLINRFDLIFTIRDLPDKIKDEKIARHILDLQRLPKSSEPVIPIPLFKKYISYAKQKIKPELTEEAINEIKDFYVTLRNTPTETDEIIKPIPVSARQLEALVRLAEGSARARLSTKVTKTDARRSINLLRSCLMEVGLDPETGKLDIDRISTGIPATQRSRIIAVQEIITNLEKKIGKLIPITRIIEEAAEKNIDESKVEEVIEKLKKSGEIFEPRRGEIQRI